jgi:hypothetical protein
MRWRRVGRVRWVRELLLLRPDARSRDAVRSIERAVVCEIQCVIVFDDVVRGGIYGSVKWFLTVEDGNVVE